MKKSPSLKTLALFIAIPPLIAVATVLYAGWRFSSSNKAQVPTASPSQSTASPLPSPTISPQFQPVTDTSPSPSPSSVSTPSVLPESARNLVSSFYTAYARKDRSSLSVLFNPDTTEDLKLLHSHLFMGVDLQGLPGGPTLFSTNSAGQWADGFSIISSAEQGVDGWIVTVQEQRKSATGVSLGSTMTNLILIKNEKNDTWLVKAYMRNGGTGKYDGFLVQ